MLHYDKRELEVYVCERKETKFSRIYQLFKEIVTELFKKDNLKNN